MKQFLLLLILSLVIEPLQAELLSVSTIKIRKDDSYEIQRIYGGQLQSRRTSNMGFESTGIVSEVLVSEGDLVKAGDILIRLDQSAAQAELDGEIAQEATASANLSAQIAQLELSKITLIRNKKLSENGHVSSQLLDELDQKNRIARANVKVAQTQLLTAKANVSRAKVIFDKKEMRAPYEAIIQDRLLDEGSIVSPGMTAMQLVENGHIEAQVGIPEPMVRFLSDTETYFFLVNQQHIPGRLKTLLPSVDNVTGTVTAVFTLDRKDLYAGSLVEMNLTVRILESGFWIPLTSLAESQRGLWSVLVVGDDILENSSKVESRLVEVIYRGKDAVYVRGTLNDGEQIIDSGTGRVVSGQSVRVAKQVKEYSRGNSDV